MISKTCQHCQLKFDVSPSRSSRKFCSPLCHNLNKRKYIILPRNCKTCGAEFTPKQQGKICAKAKYCSMKCKGADTELTKVIAEKCSKTKIDRIAKGMYAPIWNKGLHVRLSPKSEFKKGHKPWNQNLKGIHLSEKSEFKKGRISPELQPIGTITVRTRGRHSRKFIKIANPKVWKLNSRYVYEKYRGPILPDHIIHHIDRDTMNDRIENIEMLTKAQHAREHRNDRRK